MSDDSFFAEFDPRGGAAASPVASADGDQWVCSACTFLNPLALEKCKMCDTPMPVLDVAPSVPFASFSPAPRALPTQPQPGGVRSPPASAISPAKGSESSTPPPGKSAGSGPLRRMRTGSKNKDTDKAVHSASFDGLSISETSLGAKDSGSHATTPTSSPISPGTGTLEKKKSRNLFSLGRHKKKEERKDESPEKEDKKHDLDDENAGAHEKEGKEHAHHHKDAKDAKDGKDSKEDEERRKRAGSFRGWVTRKGRKGDKEDEEDAKEQQGKESENEDEGGESAEFSGDWRAIMASKRSVLIVLDNLTEETIMRRGAGKLSTGSWGRYPPAVVQPHGVVEFGAYGTTLKGTKGRCIYMIDGYDSTFIFQWSNSKVGSPEVRCIQHPKEFKVEGRGRIEKCAEVTFSIFSASGPKPKRPEPSSAAELGAHPSSPAAETGHPAPDGAVVAAVPGSPPPFPIFDNLLDDAEVQAVERFVQAQTIASFGASPREVHSPPTSGGFPFPVAGHHGVLPTPGPEPSTDGARSFENSGRAHPTMGHNPFLDPPNPFGAAAATGSAFPQLGPATEWTAETSGSGSGVGGGGGGDDDDDWGDEDEPISSPGPKLKFSIKSKEEIVPDADTTPGAFKLSSPPPAASGSKQTRRRGTPLQDRKQPVGSSPLSSPSDADGSAGGGSGGGLVFRHTGPENKGEPTTPVATRAARLVQRKTGPSGAGANGSARLKRDGLSDSAGPIAIDRKQSAEEIAARRDVLFEVGRADPPSPSPSPAPVLPMAAPLSAVTPTRADHRPTPLPAPQSDAIIRQASSMMLTCGNRMQSGQFREAFLDAESALDLLRSVPDVNSVSKPLKICIDYKLAILILMEIDILNKHPQQTPEESATIRQRAAVLAKHLSTLRLTPQHAAIAVRMAISKNIEAHNYGVASNLLQLVLSRNPPDAANLNEKLHVCKQHDETNAMHDINNPFCCRTLRLVDPSDTTACPVCNSLYAASSTGPGDQCPLCSSAAVVRR